MANEVFKKVLAGIRDPEKHNPDHARQVQRDKEKEYRALNLPKDHNRKERKTDDD